MSGEGGREESREEGGRRLREEWRKGEREGKMIGKGGRGKEGGQEKREWSVW